MNKWFLLVLLIIFAFQGCSNDTSIASKQEESPWWIAEYPILVEAVKKGNNSSLSTTYRTGPQGKEKATVTLSYKNNVGLVLKLDLPPQAVFGVDRETGEKNTSSTRHMFIIHDHDIDGVPDDFKSAPEAQPRYEETISADGFWKFRNSPEHKAISVQWTAMIGFCTNYFLHGINSIHPQR